MSDRLTDEYLARIEHAAPFAEAAEGGQTPEPGALRRAREQQGLGLREVARLAGVSPSHLSQAERGIKRLSVGTLHRLAPYIGLGPGELIAALREMSGDRR